MLTNEWANGWIDEMVKQANEMDGAYYVTVERSNGNVETVFRGNQPDSLRWVADMVKDGFIGVNMHSVWVANFEPDFMHS